MFIDPFFFLDPDPTNQALELICNGTPVSVLKLDHDFSNLDISLVNFFTDYDFSVYFSEIVKINLFLNKQLENNVLYCLSHRTKENETPSLIDFSVVDKTERISFLL